MAQLEQQLHLLPLNPGQPVQVAPGVRRMLAGNAGPMTGPGTNCYVLGQTQLTLIDPGPADEAFIEALLALGQISQILLTHTHPDHSPAAQRLSDRTGAPIYAALLPDDGHQDLSCQPRQLLIDGQIIDTELGPVQAVHTPGHVGNHFCFWAESVGLMFTGDHVMQGATVVIIPPSGDMGAYIDSVQKLQAFPIRYLAPGHGHLLADVNAYLERLIEHRLAREARVLAALGQCDAPATLAQLTPLAYTDVDPALHGVAAYSLWAHLRKLQAERQVVEYCEGHWLFDQARWALADSAGTHIDED